MKKDLEIIRRNIKPEGLRVVMPHTCFSIFQDLNLSDENLSVDILFISRAGEIKMEYNEKWKNPRRVLFFDDHVHGNASLTQQILRRGNVGIESFYVISVFPNDIDKPKWDAQQLEEIEVSEREYFSLYRGGWGMWVERRDIIEFIKHRFDKR